MKGSLVLICVLSSINFINGEDYTCPSGQSTKSITVNDGDSFIFKTQEGKKYGPNVDCTVNFLLGSTCKKIQYNCPKLVLKGKGKNCKKGDKIIVSVGKKRKFICGNRAKLRAASGRNSRLQLLTDNISGRRGSGPGGACRISCLEGSSSSSTTPPQTQSPPPSSGNVLEKISLDQYPLAQCNDKTTAVYYRYPDINQATTRKMLIYLQGGGSCVPDGNGCNSRCNNQAPHLCTASTSPTYDVSWNKFGDTIMSSDATENPAFHDYSYVYAPYCSSDLWSGTANASTATEGRVFHGKYIFKAIINDLLANTWLKEASDLVLVGTSAGSAGVDRNCDWMSDQVKSVNSDVNVKCIMDSGSFLPINTYFKYCSSNDGDQDDPTDVWQPELDESCVTDSSDIGECKTLTLSYKYVTTTSMILTSATDSFHLNNCVGYTSDNSETVLAEWRSEITEAARNVSSERSDFGIHIGNCPYHTSVANRGVYLYDVPVEDGSQGEKKNLRDILNNFTKQTTPKIGIDNIDSLNPGCRN